MRIIHIPTKSGGLFEIIVPDEPILRRPDHELTTEERLAAVQRYIMSRHGSCDGFNAPGYVDPGEGMIIGSVDGVHITDETPLDPDQWEGGQPWHTKPKP